MTNLREFELLAPAGNWESARAAVENGADAIYFGLEAGFNARARATNFSLDELPRLMAFLHQRNVRGFVTLNTLVFSDELEALTRHAAAVAASGADAVLVQDLGVARYLQDTHPALERHASTQMSLTSQAGMELAAELGISRVVLPRELSVDEITAIQPPPGVGLEAFVHGALCVAYSGQCLTSESLGGRSANRGQCAQACRLPYEVVCDGKDVPLGDVQYLLSPQDLAAYDWLPQLIRAGVRCFKIEGRLKTPEYVANVTRHYRAALDAAIAASPWTLDPTSREELELSFSRGFSPGWLGGCDHKMLVPGESSAKRGVLLGTVVDVQSSRVILDPQTSVKAGDGIVFEGNRQSGDEQGGRVLAARILPPESERPPRVSIALRREDVDFRRVAVGQRVWKTDDPQLNKRLRATFAGPDPLRRVALDLTVTATAGEPLHVVAVADNSASCELTSDDILPVARKHPVTEEGLREQLGRLGGSVYRLRQLTAHIDGVAMAPLSLLGRVRKDLLQSLAACFDPRAQVPSSATSLPAPPPNPGLWNPATRGSSATAPSTSPNLHVLCRRLDQLPIAWGLADDVSLELADIREYREGMAMAKATGRTLALATPRIEKPGELGIFHLIAKQGGVDRLGTEFRGLGLLPPIGLRLRRRFLAQRRQCLDHSTAKAMGCAPRHGQLRFESRPVAPPTSSRAAPRLGSRSSPTHANVPYGTLRVLCSAIPGDEQDELRASLRRPSGGIARSRGDGTSLEGRRGLPKYLVQCNAAEFCGDHSPTAQRWRPPLTRRTSGQHSGKRPQHLASLSGPFVGQVSGSGRVATVTCYEPRRRDARQPGIQTRPARDSLARSHAPQCVSAGASSPYRAANEQRAS